MRSPLRLPLCPYCGARFFYGQVSRTKGERQGQCPHCSGKFVIAYKKQRAFLFLGAAAVAVPLNILLLWGLDVNSLIPLFVVTLITVVLAVLLVPFVVRYQKRPPKVRRRDKAEGMPGYKTEPAAALKGKQSPRKNHAK